MNGELLIKANLQKALTDIAEVDFKTTVITGNPGMLDGTAGLSLFYYQLYHYTDNEQHLQAAFEYFQHSFNNAVPEKLLPSHGITGVMWLLNYYKKMSAFDADFETYLAPFDTYLVKAIDETLMDMDPMHGILGFSGYFLERGNDIAITGLKKIIARLDQNKLVTPEGYAWENGNDEDILHNVRHINLGLAHGIPAILYYLSRFIHAGIEVDKCRELLSNGLTYLLSMQDKSADTYFPNRIQQGEVRKNPRIAYCYGDLGIACGLALAAKYADEQNIRAHAIDVAENIARVAIRDIQFVDDIGLCHGAAGNGYMFYRLYRLLGSPILKEAALSQFDQLLKLKTPDTGIAGFAAWDITEETKYYFRRANPGLIEGVVGIGLGIVSFLQNEEEDGWSKILLLS